MTWVALRMLVGDTAKYLGLIFGISFATVLMTQQISIFMGILTRTANQIVDVHDATIWVMDPKTRYLDEAPGLTDTSVQLVRGAAGVDWAAKFYYGQISARLNNGDFRASLMIGLDDTSMVGAPQEMILGNLADLKQPDAVIVDKAGYEYMWGGQPLKIGHEFEINSRRVKLVGICKASAPFITLPVLYTRESNLRHFFSNERKVMNYVLAAAQDGLSTQEVCRSIEARTGLAALTKDEFFWKTIHYFVKTTGIPINFGITIALGFIVGAAITGQTFYLFTLENLKQFGALKAMGVTNGRLLGMVLLQAITVGLLGYCIGLGLTAIFFESTKNITHLAGLSLSPLAAGGVGVAVFVIICLSAVFASARVLFLEPAVVFRG